MSSTSEKKYIYKISHNGTYLGDLRSVTSDFGYRQDINSAGAQLNITVNLTADTASNTIESIQDETGADITDEFGVALFTERQPDLVGSGNEDALIANDNTIEVVEYSSYYPNGTTVFQGYISKWTAVYGAEDNVVVTCLSSGQDLSQYLVGDTTSGATLQINQPNNTAWTASPSSFSYLGNTILPTSSYLISSMKVSIQTLTDGLSFELLFFQTTGAPSSTMTLLGTANSYVATAGPYSVAFVFAEPISVVSGQTYFYYWRASGGTGSYAYYGDGTRPYGQLYTYSAGTWYAQNASDTFKVYSQTHGLTTLVQTAQDPKTMLSTVLTDYNSRGGLVSLDPAAALTGLSLNYTFKSVTVLDAVKAILSLAPSGWYWYVDPASNILYFKATSTTADHTIVKGREIGELKIEATKEFVYNNVYFTGGDDGSGTNVYIQVTDVTSLANNRVGIAMISDNRVTVAADATQIAQNYIDAHSDETYTSSAKILDNRTDASTFKLGEMVGFSGFGTFVDNLLLQIVAIDKTPDATTISLGSPSVKTSKQVQSILERLTKQETSSNPTYPS